MSDWGNSLVRLSISRPILITVINLLIMLAGLASIPGLDIRELPDVDRPIVTVRAELSGASPLTMDTEVTSIMENAVARVSGVQNIISSSEEDNMRMRIEFRTGVNLHEVASEVREAISRAERDLPSDVDDVSVLQADADSQPIIQMSAFSNTITIEELAKKINKEVVPTLLSVDGVAEVRISGEQQRVMHIKLDSGLMAANKVSVSDVSAALNQARFDVPAGNYKSAEQDLIVRAFASLVDPKKLEKLFVKDNIRLEDIGQVYLGAEDADSFSLLNGRMVVGMGIVRQAGANTIAISNAVTKVVQSLNSSTKDFQIVISSDDAIYIKGALYEVLLTLGFAIIIVLLLIAMFLEEWRAVIIPAVTIPISLIGTLAVIWLLGFSINLLTLLALVLATGLIVDDAIVVFENIFRRMQGGLSLMAAAVKGTEQVFFAVIATTATLIAVFIPIAFLPGDTGRLFREFALVLTVAVAISAFVAVTLCAMLSTKLLGIKTEADWFMAVHKPLKTFGRSFASLYYSSLHGFLVRPYFSLLAAIIIAVVGAFGFILIDKELVPQEDRGMLRVTLTGPDGSSLLYSNQQSQVAEAILLPYQERGNIKDIYTTVGQWDKNRVDIITTLPDWNQRNFSQNDLAKQIDADFKDVPGAQIRILQENSLNISGAGAGLKIALLGNDYNTISEAAYKLADTLTKEIAEVQDVIVDYDTSQPELSFDIDREKANDLKVSMSTISETLRALVDNYELIKLNVEDESIPIVLSSIKESIRDPKDILNISVTNADNDLIPLSALINIRESGVSAELDRHNQRRGIELDIRIPPGTSLNKVVNDIREVAANVLPSGIDIMLLGESAKLDETSHEMQILMIVAIALVFLVLAAQFESWGSAIVVIFTVPFGLVAAIFALLLSGQTINLYSQIGLILLVGLMTKNSILLVEFMDQLRDEGRSVTEAISEGVRVRFRPIVMTVLATILGCVPLMLGTGPGAEARVAIGWVVFGGLGISTIFTLYLTPLAYSLIAPHLKTRAHTGNLLEEELRDSDNNKFG